MLRNNAKTQKIAFKNKQSFRCVADATDSFLTAHHLERHYLRVGPNNRKWKECERVRTKKKSLTRHDMGLTLLIEPCAEIECLFLVVCLVPA